MNDMKKEYIQPAVGIKDAMADSAILGNSENITSQMGETEMGIKYGGVDTNGEKDPESRGMNSYSVWDD